MILLIGVLIFLTYAVRPGPMLFNPVHEREFRAKAPEQFIEVESRYNAAVEVREGAAMAAVRARAQGQSAVAEAATTRFAIEDRNVNAARTEALATAAEISGVPARDANYIIPRFVLDRLPIGLAGLFLAAVLAAAMSSIAAELNSLSTATVVDFYKRWFRKEASETHYLNASKLATAVWGAFACVVAVYAATLGSLIEVVNRFGSFFYGSILGVFLLAMIPAARGVGAFVALIAGMGAVAAVSFGRPDISFLWHNIIGAVVVVSVGMLISLVENRNNPRPPAGAEG
jgi:hypothetical protein